MRTSGEERAARDHIVDVGRRMWGRALVAANDGNVSVRLDDDRILCTPTRVSKGAMTPEQLTIVALDGTVLDPGTAGGPSSEIRMHLGVYRASADVRAVVHAHPVHATALAILGEPALTRMQPEVILTMPDLPIAPYATPSTEDVPASVAPLVGSVEACLLEQHGALTWAADLETAYLRMERVEQVAHLTVLMRQLGRSRDLEPEKLGALAERHGVTIPR